MQKRLMIFKEIENLYLVVRSLEVQQKIRNVDENVKNERKVNGKKFKS